MLATPRQVVPLSSVMNARRSTPDTVSVGAVPPGHLTLGQVIAADPPFVNSKTNPLVFVEDCPLKVNVVEPAIVAVT